jgi:hypothetical protein
VITTRHHETPIQGRHHRTVQNYKTIDIMAKRSNSAANLYHSMDRDWIDTSLTRLHVNERRHEYFLKSKQKSAAVTTTAFTRLQLK